MLKKFVVFSFAFMFVFGGALTASASGDHVEVKFSSNDNMQSDKIIVSGDAHLAVSVTNKNEDVQVQYAVMKVPYQEVTKGVVEPGQEISFEMPVTEGAYYIQGKSRNVRNTNDYGFMNGEGFGSLTVIQ